MKSQKFYCLNEQGNLNESQKIFRYYLKILPYIFNLGHGLLPETDPDKVEKLN